MNILTDFHHAGLLNSLILLFEKRLGYKVFRPIGMEWLDNGFWAVYDHPETAKQFLGLQQGYRPIDGTLPLNQIKLNFNKDPNTYYCHDIASNYWNRAITFDRFKELDFDIVIASLPQHIEPFTRLIKEYKPNAKLVYQIGNNWNVTDETKIKNVMASAQVKIPSHIHSVTYHQEFDTDVFHFVPNVADNKITSFVNCFNTADLFKSDWELFTKVEKLMPNWQFRSFGGSCRDGACHGDKEVASYMHESKYIWHTKRGGDGYGHIIHNVFAVGRPPIVNMSYYSGKLAEKLMIDGQTCIAIDGLNPEQIVNKILQTDAVSMSINAHNVFTKYVDFNEDEKNVRQFIKLLQ
jgi:hypothetical protein